jgi:GcrA cell cycle regulator
MSQHRTSYEWPENTVAQLRELWSEGHSTTEIGRRLGVSKNAIVGKAHRLDLPARPSPIKRGAPGGPRPRRRAKVIPRSLLQNSDARVPIDRQREAATTGNGGSFRLRVKYSRV